MKKYLNKINTDYIDKVIIKGLISLGLILLLLFWDLIPYLIFIILKKDFSNINPIFKTICLFINSLIFLSILILIYYKDLKNNFKNFFNKNFINNIKLAISYWLLGFGIMIISNLIIVVIMNGTLTENEEAVRELIKAFPLYMAYRTIIFAPITEELVFRKSIREYISNKYLYAIISGIIFGGLHVITSLTNMISLVYLIPYCALGIVFGFLYVKSDNIFSTIIVHAIHNTLAFLLIL